MKNVQRWVLVALVGSLAACSDDEISVETLPISDASLDGPRPTGDGSADGSAVDSGEILPQGQFNRVGRPFVKLALIQPQNRPAYSAFDTFTDLVKYPVAVEADLQGGLVRADLWDGVDDWNGGDIPFDGGAPPDAAVGGSYLKHPLGKLIQLDALLIDTKLPFSANGFLDLEREAGGGPAHTKSGGRWLAEDTLDAMLSLLVKQEKAPVSDNVNAPAIAPSSTFPYLPPPTP